MKKPIVMQTDFGHGVCVATMHGVCNIIDPEVLIVDSNHDIAPFDIYEGSTKLDYIADFWPEGTVFVSVVDPGVGTSRKGAVALLNNNTYVVTPDNGSLTHVKERIGIKEIREIDESVHFWPTSNDIAIFHGRDVFAYTAIKLASHQISFEEVGPSYSLDEVVTYDLQEPIYSDGKAEGFIDWTDRHFGLVSFNFYFRDLIEKTKSQVQDSFKVIITHDDKIVYNETVKLVNAFGDVAAYEPLLYTDETNKIALGLNLGNIIEKYNLNAGTDWHVSLERI